MKVETNASATPDANTSVLTRPAPIRYSAHLLEKIERDFTSRWTKQWGGRHLLHGRTPGTDAVRLDGNDYLGLCGHPDIIRAQCNTLRTDSQVVIQSSAFLHGEHPVRALEQKMASWIGKEHGMLCQSGYAANIGLIQAIADSSTPVYVDMLAHASLWEGARAANAPAYAFRHNDPAHLARMIHQHGKGLVIVDSVYSTTGAICPLEEMVSVAEEHDCMILVDESHSLGTHGPEGAGLCKALNLTDRVHFITTSLAKAFAGRAGFFTIPADIRNYVQVTSFPNIFSSCLLPHEISGLSATLDVISRSDLQRERLQANTRIMRDGLSALGYPIHQGTEQIIALEAGPEASTMVLRDALEERGVFGAVFCAPATGTNRSMVRLTLSASLTKAELDHVLNVADDISQHVQPWAWPIARRQAIGSRSQMKQ